jgi:hypothetical protein
MREHLPQLDKRDPSRDLEIINAHAAELNQEAEDVLSYQVMKRRRRFATGWGTLRMP